MNTTKYAYEVTLTENEEKTLVWLSHHGYDSGFYEASSSIIADETEENMTYKFTEHDAWNVLDEYNDDPDAFLACSSNHSLNEKLINFIQGII
jgi:hypothetical protein